MAKIFRLLPGVVVVLLVAAEPAAPARTGRVLVLDNERTLEGDIERVGDQYRVRRAIGETWVPGNKALYLCGSLEEAYAYLRSQANLRDADEHVRLARWCFRHGLRSQAAAEAAEAVALKPEHVEARRLSNSFQRTAAQAPTPPAPMPLPEEPEAIAVTPPGLEVNAECLGTFATKVQPILINACSTCHASGRGGAFKLLRPFEGGSGGRRTAQQNLAAVLAQLNAEKPEASPLLMKAASPHGGMAQPAFKGRQAAALRTLEDWVRQAVANSPMAHEPSVPSLPAETRPATETSAAAEQPAKATPPPPTPADPFDPEIFNRQVHPKP